MIEYGLLGDRAPGLLINGKLAWAGSVPTKEQVTEWMQHALAMASTWRCSSILPCPKRRSAFTMPRSIFTLAEETTMPEFLETTVDKFIFKVATNRYYSSEGVWALPSPLAPPPSPGRRGGRGEGAHRIVRLLAAA